MILPLAFAIVSALAPLNCANPDTPLRARLCAEPSLRAADNSLTAAYNALFQRTQAASRAPLRAMFDRFESARNACLTRGEGRDDCLLNETDAQRFRLTGAPFGGSGTGSPMAGVFVGRVASDRFAPWENLLPRFVEPARPGERIFNQAMDQVLREAPFRRDPDPYRARDMAFGAAAEIAYATPEFISARVTIVEPSQETAAAIRRFGVNQLLDGRRRTSFETLFRDEAIGGLVQTCRVQIVAQRRERLSGVSIFVAAQIDMVTLQRSIVDLESWVFSASGADVMIDQGPSGADYVCRFEAVELSAHLHPHVVVWP